ncbi:MAG: biopolymer transporter ExbD [Rhodobacteraceae bacterium]|nr:biopolymer transporter ExbD [Paracoccaceae bacterium]
MSGPKTMLPVRKRSYRVSLTPLADAMFQLLTFFMLTTSLTPYSLITIGTSQEAPSEVAEAAGAEATGGDNDANDAAVSQQPGLVIWELEDGVIRTSGSVYQRDQLGDLSAALALRTDNVSVQLVLGPTARIQDVASAMAALKGAAVEKVELKRFEAGL